MRNVLHILKRDILRLLKVPPAIVVVVALLILPSVYTWYNVIGFWNPYQNTGDLRVEVVNDDKGASSELTGQIDVGDLIVDALKENDQLEWGFSSYDDAMFQLESGNVYAVFVIPEDFTEKLLTITTGDFQKPDIDYYVNEKAGPVAPKITDSGATTLDETINSTFVKTVSEKAVEAIDTAMDQSRDRSEERQSLAAARLGDAINHVDEVTSSMQDLQGAAESMGEKIAGARNSLGSAQSAIDEAADSLNTISSLSSSLQSDLSKLSGQAMPAVNQSIQLISQTSAKAAETAADLAQAAGVAQGDISAAIGDANAIISGNEAAIESLRQIAGSIPDGTNGKAELLQAIQTLENANDRASANLEILKQANDRAASVTQSALDDMNAVNDAVQKAASEAAGYSNTLFGTVIPSIQNSLGALSAASSAAGSSINSQKALIDQARNLTSDMDETNSITKEALAQTIDLLGGLKAELETIRTDVVSIGVSDAIVELLGDDSADGLDAQRIADFMGSPTTLVTEQLYTLNAYGAAMAPLFMNLTFWIGAFMLMVIMRQEVDGKGIRRLTLTQRYLGRFLLFAIMVILQASICCAGLPIIGVEIQSLPALFFAAIISSLAYLSIIYALSVTLQHIGKGICIVLVFAQIPGATGLYPIEMTAPFFQTVYPFLPFTYGISAMRESICGFYGMHYLNDILMLTLFFAIFMAFGILVRPFLSNVNRMVARQIRQSGIYNGENVEVPARRYRLSQVVRTLADRDEYRRALESRYESFSRIYPKLIKWCAVIGVVVPIAFTVVFSLTMNEKIILLNAWLLWLVLVFLALVIIESLRASIVRQMRLEDMSDDELRHMYLERNRMEPVGDAAIPSFMKGARAGEKLRADHELVDRKQDGECAAPGEGDAPGECAASGESAALDAKEGSDDE